MKPLTNRQKQSLNTKRRIEEAADICFARKGMAYTLISDIIAEAGVSVGTFYHYFPNKNALLVSRFLPFDFSFLEEAERLLSYDDAQKGLVDFALFFSRSSLSPTPNAMNLEYLKARTTITIEELWPKNRPYFLILCTMIAKGQARKQLRRDMSPGEIGELVMVLSRGYNLDWASTDGAYSLRERMEKHLPLLFQGLLYTPQREGPYDGSKDPLPEQVIPAQYREETEKLRELCRANLEVVLRNSSFPSDL